MLLDQIYNTSNQFEGEFDKKEIEEEEEDLSVYLIKYHCFNPSAIGWQVGCVLITLLFLYMQHTTNTVLSEYNRFFNNHCKCFYIKPNTTNYSPPPSYNELCENGLPSYATANIIS